MRTVLTALGSRPAAERHYDKSQGRLIVGKTSSAQRGLDLFERDIPDHALAQRNVMHAIYQRKDLNIANLVFADRLRDGPLSRRCRQRRVYRPAAVERLFVARNDCVVAHPGTL
jgi:hypothetical protein